MSEVELRKGNNTRYPWEVRVGAMVRQFEFYDEARDYLLQNI
jgi:hypothetical protein